MNNNRLLVIMLCLITVLMVANKAEAWTWRGFSNLVIEDTVRGKEGTTITFTLHDLVLYTQCYNVNTDNFDQPGVGNYGGIELIPTTYSDPSKEKGTITVYGELPLSRWDNHDMHETPEDHTCWPFTNDNKVELPDSGWIAEFTADWVWKDDNNKIINSGTDTCTWTGEVIDGYPVDSAPFECISTSDKKVNYILEK